MCADLVWQQVKQRVRGRSAAAAGPERKLAHQLVGVGQRGRQRGRGEPQPAGCLRSQERAPADSPPGFLRCLNRQITELSHDRHHRLQVALVFFL